MTDFANDSISKLKEVIKLLDELKGKLNDIHELKKQILTTIN